MLVLDGSSWDRSAEVVVVGYGIGGAVAAISSAENGAEPIVLEKQVQDRHHSNTSMSGGTYTIPSDARTALEYLTALCRVAGKPDLAWTDPDVLRAWAEYAASSHEWVEARTDRIFTARGTGDHPHLPGGTSFTKYRFKGMGIGLVKFLEDQVKAKGISVLYETRATHLLTDLRGRVVGVEALVGENGQTRKVRFRAARGVVLASGGFEFDEQMKLNYLPVYPTHFTGSEALTGDGIRMAVEVGAQLWHMNCASARLVMKFPGLPSAFSPAYLGKTAIVQNHNGPQAPSPVASGHILVDRDGRRYTSENVKSHSLYYELALFDSHRLLYPRVPSYLIFDRRRMQKGPLPNLTGGSAGPTRRYRWSADNSVELEKGWIKTADTLRDLARKVGLPVDNLERTVRTFNRYCDRGCDPEFARQPGDLIPLDNPPYYAVELWPGGPNTQGGPRRNSKGQILNTDGEPIAGLYGSGELGSIYGMLYPGAGGNLTEGFAFGRIVGENLAREKP